MTDGEIFLLSVLLKRPGNQRASQTWRRVDVALSCHAVVHLETVMSDLGAVFRSYSRACLAPAGHGMLCCKPAGSCSIVWEVDSSWNQTWQHIDPLWAQIMDPKMIQHSFCLYLPIFFPHERLFIYQNDMVALCRRSSFHMQRRFYILLHVQRILSCMQLISLVQK